MPGKRNFQLSPSDFAFLWQECPRCFYLKLVNGFKRPGGPFPSIFGVIDSAMRAHFMGARTEVLSPDLPPGTVTLGEKWVTSAPIHVPGHAATVSIRGKFDTVARFDDNSYAVIDFKTSNIKPRSVQLYARQLRAYAHALENPAPGKLALSPISVLGLLAFTPETFTTVEARDATLTGALRWYPVRRNPASFMSFLDEVLTVLELPVPPAPGEKCQWCAYREESRANGL